MGLTITYRDGSVRIINPMHDFFKDSETAIRDKVERICHDTGITFNAKLSNGAKTHIEIEHPRNKPFIRRKVDTKSSKKAKIENRRAICEHKKNLFNPSFSIIIKKGVLYKLEELKLQRKLKRNK